MSHPPKKKSQPLPKKSHLPPKKFHPIPKKIATPPEKNLTPPEIFQPPIYLMVLVNGTFAKQSYKVCIAHCFSYIARQSILNYE